MATETTQASEGSKPPAAPRSARGMRERIARRFGVDDGLREACLRGMLTSHRKDVASYWFQLAIATGIATLGLVLGSSAVVIGAMLISPLMSPLVSFGMGLAVGSGVLTLRALARTLLSVAFVVIVATTITTLLPFHEVTTEISARTSPTALDLFVAALCALMAAYTAIRPGSETASTGAGAAIGIALVPPLCVAGWGLGTGRFDVAKGSALLFTANLSAIFLLTVLSFRALAFGRVDVAQIERDAHEQQPRGVAGRLAGVLRRIFGSSYGALIRWGVPLALAAVVFVPLRRALELVTWQVRVRGEVGAIVDATLPPSRSVSSRVHIDG
ncbi:MAG TPA: DUF389 domain-containing protein, partial [Minicystis sp.]|nr:DUF389 domain-containing protein [Minicystis sp.]